MKRYWSAALASSLLLACAARAGAVSFLPVPADPTATESADSAVQSPTNGLTHPSARFRAGLFAASWKMPQVSVAHHNGLQPGDAVRFETRVMPVLELDYRAGKRVRIGAWYNPADSRVWFQGPTADLLKASPQPVIGTRYVAHATLNMWNLQVAYLLPHQSSLSLGVRRYQGSLGMRVPNWQGSGDLAFSAELGATEVELWYLRSGRVWDNSGLLAYLTGGLGVSHRVAHDSGSPGNKSGLDATVGFAVFPWNNLSLNASVWLADLTTSDSFTARLSTGIAGHF